MWKEFCKHKWGTYNDESKCEWYTIDDVNKINIDFSCISFPTLTLMFICCSTHVQLAYTCIHCFVKASEHVWFTNGPGPLPG